MYSQIITRFLPDFSRLLNDPQKIWQILKVFYSKDMQQGFSLTNIFIGPHSLLRIRYTYKYRIPIQLAFNVGRNISRDHDDINGSENFLFMQQFINLYYDSQRQITLRIVGYHFSSRLTATLSLFLIYLAQPSCACALIVWLVLL